MGNVVNLASRTARFVEELGLSPRYPDDGGLFAQAAKDGEAEKIIYESADVIYHIMALLTFCDLSIEDVLRELRRREGTSGIDEKNSRTTK